MMPSYGCAGHQASILLKLQSHPSKFHITHHTWHVTQSLSRINQIKLSSVHTVVWFQHFRGQLYHSPGTPTYSIVITIVLRSCWLIFGFQTLDLAWIFDVLTVAFLSCITQPNQEQSARHWFSFFLQKRFRQKICLFQFKCGSWVDACSSAGS